MEVSERACGDRCRNFKFAALGRIAALSSALLAFRLLDFSERIVNKSAESPAARGSVMASVTYYVAMAFEKTEEGDLVALDPMESQSSTQAISRARSLATSKAGAVAFSRTGDPDIGEFADAVVLFKTGEVPDELPAG